MEGPGAAAGRATGVVPYVLEQVRELDLVRHLYFTDSEVRIRKVPGPIPNLPLASQIQEALLFDARTDVEPPMTIPYREVEEVRLHGAEHRSLPPRLTILARRTGVPWTFAIGARDEATRRAKIGYVLTLLPPLLPTAIRLSGFGGQDTMGGR